MKKYILAPSLLGADFWNLEAEINKCLDHDVNWIHYDVMDFHFVPNLTFGSKILQDIKSRKNINVDIHFMVEIKTDFDFFFKDYIAAKPKMMTMHYESLKTSKQIKKFIELCHKHKILASIAISPKTSVEKIIKYLPLLDNVLVMSVEPGFGGQKFLEVAIPKIKFLDDYRQSKNLKYTIEVDGGINDETVGKVQASGVDMIVAGSYFFKAKDVKKTVEKLVNYGK